jgi:hypothetical protein
VNEGAAVSETVESPLSRHGRKADALGAPRSTRSHGECPGPIRETEALIAESTSGVEIDSKEKMLHGRGKSTRPRPGRSLSGDAHEPPTDMAAANLLTVLSVPEGEIDGEHLKPSRAKRGAAS